METVSKKCFVRTISVILILTCTFLFTEIAICQQVDTWEDQTDELPGTGNDTPWIIAGVGVALGLATWLIFFNGSDDKNEKPKSVKTSDEKKNVAKDSTSKSSLDTTVIKRNDSDKETPGK